ncbi:MAG: ABC transporter permease [Planctomycetota bacterium]|nr:ABC transporter permease [Planctomycetota bacterium]
MKLLRLVAKNLRRRPMRTLLTVGGVACAMLMLVLVQSLGAGLDRALSGSEAARTLIVYRLNRYCPQTSFLPEWYGPRIEQLDGVASVLPVKVYLNNCRASLDIVPFNGVPAERLAGSRKFDMLDGDYERFLSERDSALVGRAFAERKHLSVGDQFRFGGINVKVAGIFGSSEPVEEGTVVTHLEYLQRAVAVNRLGTVTQFEVKIDDPSRAKEISASIDDLFRTGPEPTDTRPRILFLEHATRDLREILRFAELLGLACVAVVLALVANTVAMSVQERVREFGVFRTLGFHARHIAAVLDGAGADRARFLDRARHRTGRGPRAGDPLVAFGDRHEPEVGLRCARCPSTTRSATSDAVRCARCSPGCRARSSRRCSSRRRPSCVVSAARSPAPRSPTRRSCSRPSPSATSCVRR